MLTRLHRARRGTDEGFTLIELLVVMIIIGILAAIAVPVFLSQRQKAADTSVKSDVTAAGNEISTYYVDHAGKFTTASIASGTLTLTDDTTPTALTVKVKVSPGTAAPTAGSIITNLTGGTCTNATGWVVHLYNSGGSTKDWYYSAQGGLSTTAPTACA